MSAPDIALQEVWQATNVTWARGELTKPLRLVPFRGRTAWTLVRSRVLSRHAAPAGVTESNQPGTIVGIPNSYVGFVPGYRALDPTPGYRVHGAPEYPGYPYRDVPGYRYQRTCTPTQAAVPGARERTEL
eukprot:3175463-Rhodomonas_salina.2